jgi:hypothetical protein
VWGGTSVHRDRLLTWKWYIQTALSNVVFGIIHVTVPKLFLLPI